MSALDDVRNALTKAYGENVVFDGLTVDDLLNALIRDAKLDAEAYPGELAMLVFLVRALRSTVREDSSLPEVRRLLWLHASDDAAARQKAKEKSSPAGAGATPDFFQPGHTYARESHASTIRFLVRYIDDSPDGIDGYRVAFGWRTEDGDVCASPFDCDDFTGWTDVTEGGAPDA